MAGRAGEDRGSVTTELALALPAVVLVLAVVLAVSGAAVAQQRSSDAARVVARLAAVGESPAVLETAARRVAGAGASVDVTVTGDGWVEALVTAPGGGAWFLDGPLVVSGRAVAPLEAP